MKKVLFISNNLNIGGMEKALVSLLNSFDYSKYCVTLLLEKNEGVLLNQLNPNIKVKEYKVSNFKIVIIRKLINFIHMFFWSLKNKNKYDFSCCYATYSRIGNILSRIASENNSLYVHSNYYEYLNHNKAKIRELFDDLNVEKFKSVIFVSNEAKQGILTIYPHLYNRFFVINNIFDYEIIDKLKDEKIDYKKSNKVVFLFVGRLEEESKKITRLIKSVDLLKDLNSNFELLIIGGGEKEEEYRKLIHDKGLDKYIKMFGEKENPYPYYKLADYIIMVSNFEGFPVIYNESIYMKKNLLTTINCSDDSINIEKDIATILEKDPGEISKTMLMAITGKLEKKENNIDFKKINRERVNRIYKIIEGDK